MNKITVLFCGLSVVTGIVLSIHAILKWNHVEVIVEWETASELDTVGFNLHRSESPEGTYKQVNSEMIPTGSDSITGHQYTYQDIVPKTGTTYYYLLEEIEVSGIGNRHGPIEVTAQNSAQLELILSIFLIVGAAILLIYSWQDIRHQDKEKSDDSS